MKANRVAMCAVFVALLIAVQYVMNFVPGVELVTVLMLCFCYAAGPCAGMISATCFSLLRCLIFGFVPNVLILYLVYYNLFALLFGFLGKRPAPPWVGVSLLIVVALLSGYFAAAGLPVSAVYKMRATVMLWFIFSITAIILFIYIILLAKNKSKKGRELADAATLAVVCTMCFSLLDDIITPLFYGYTADAAAAYFIASLYVMIVQSICALISVLLLFHPLAAVFKRACG